MSNVARIQALNGQGREANQIMERLLREHPSDTLLQAVDAPLVLAASHLRSARADEAVRALEAVKPYEFGTYAGLLPNYVRATAYLELHRAEEAAAEFRSVIDHRGLSPVAITWVLSQLGLGRAYAMQGDAARARAAYDVFFARWKDADPDIPLLKRAKAEYAKLN
jgi:predicted Zn-dependent protease